MSQPAQSGDDKGRFVAFSCNVSQLPDENLATLSRMDFQVLRDGEVSEAKAGRDLCLGFLASSIVGIIGLIATVDWDTTIHQARKGPFLWTGLLLAIASGSAIGAIIHHIRLGHMKKHSAYSTLMKRLADHFYS